MWWIRGSGIWKQTMKIKTSIDNRNEQIFLRFKYSLQSGDRWYFQVLLWYLARQSPGERRLTKTTNQPARCQVRCVRCVLYVGKVMIGIYWQVRTSCWALIKISSEKHLWATEIVEVSYLGLPTPALSWLIIINLAVLAVKRYNQHSEARHCMAGVNKLTDIKYLPSWTTSWILYFPLYSTFIA